MNKRDWGGRYIETFKSNNQELRQALLATKRNEAMAKQNGNPMGQQGAQFGGISIQGNYNQGPQFNQNAWGQQQNGGSQFGAYQAGGKMKSEPKAEAPGSAPY